MKPMHRLMARSKKKKDAAKASVEGEAARPRLDRPARMNRAEGGSVTNKEYAAEKRKEAESHRTMQGLNSLQALTNTAVGAISKGKIKGLNLGMGALGGVNTAERYRRGREAAADADRAERGLADEGKEDRRKRGGKVCK